MSQFTNGRFQALLADGTPIAGGFLYSYASGTTTPQATYTDGTLTTANTNPVILNSRGEAQVWISSLPYSFTLKDSLGNTIWSVDNITDGSGFSSALQAALANPAQGAALVQYQYTYAGSVARTVTSGLSDFVTTSGFAGIDNTGVADSTGGMQNFLNVGGRLRIMAGTYKITGSGILSTKSNTHLVIDPGVIFDLSGVTTPNPGVNTPWSNTSFGLVFKGGIGSPVSLTANAAAQTNALVLTDVTGIAQDDWLQVSSTRLYETDTNTPCGELRQVLAVNTGTKTVTLTEPLYLTYNTADTAVVRKMAFAENIVVEGKAEFRGAYAGLRQHGALLFWYCRNVTVRDITTNKTDYVGMQFYKCLDVLVDGVTCKKDSYTGGNIGVSLVYGTSNVKVINSQFYDLCHAVDASGDTAIGGICMDVYALNNQCFNMHGSSMNTHPGVGGMFNFSFNEIHMSVGLNSSTPTGMCGIRCQGPLLTAIGNRCYNVTGNGIQHQWETTPNVPKVTIIEGNQLYASPTNSTDFPGNIAILCQGYSGATPSDVDSIRIAGNFCQGFETGPYAFAFNNNISRVVMEGNTVKVGAATGVDFGCVIRAATGFTVGTFTMSGNDIEVASGTTQCCYVAGIDVGSITNGSIAANTFTNGTNSIRLDNVAGVVERGNTCTPDGGGKKYLVGANSTGVSLDRWQSSERTVATSTATINPEDDAVTFNVAATCTVTLPDPTKWPGRELNVRTITAQLVNSASSNVVPLAGGAAGTAILAATAGKWARLRSDGTAWQIRQGA